MSAAQALIRVNENSQVGEARRNAVRIAEVNRCSTKPTAGKGRHRRDRTWRTILLRHATGGEILLRDLNGSKVPASKLTCHRSRSGNGRMSPAAWRTAIRPAEQPAMDSAPSAVLSTEFDIFHAAGGTVIVSRVLAAVRSAERAMAQWGVIMRACIGRNLVRRQLERRRERWHGLHHGRRRPGAWPAGRQGCRRSGRIFDEDPFQTPAGILDAAHWAMRLDARGGDGSRRRSYAATS